MSLIKKKSLRFFLSGLAFSSSIASVVLASTLSTEDINKEHQNNPQAVETIIKDQETQNLTIPKMHTSGNFKFAWLERTLNHTENKNEKETLQVIQKINTEEYLLVLLGKKPLTQQAQEDIKKIFREFSPVNNTVLNKTKPNPHEKKLNGNEEDNLTLLKNAVIGNNVSEITRLIDDEKVDINSYFDHFSDENALNLAIRCGHTELAKELINNFGADPQNLNPQNKDNQNRDNSCTSIVWAAVHGNLEMVRFLHEEKNISLTNLESSGFNAFFGSAVGGNPDIFNYIATKEPEKIILDEIILFYAIIEQNENYLSEIMGYIQKLDKNSLQKKNIVNLVRQAILQADGEFFKKAFPIIYPTKKENIGNPSTIGKPFYEREDWHKTPMLISEYNCNNIIDPEGIIKFVEDNWEDHANIIPQYIRISLKENINPSIETTSNNSKENNSFCLIS